MTFLRYLWGALLLLLIAGISVASAVDHPRNATFEFQQGTGTMRFCFDTTFAQDGVSYDFRMTATTTVSLAPRMIPRVVYYHDAATPNIIIFKNDLEDDKGYVNGTKRYPAAGRPSPTDSFPSNRACAVVLVAFEVELEQVRNYDVTFQLFTDDFASPDYLYRFESVPYNSVVEVSPSKATVYSYRNPDRRAPSTAVSGYLDLSDYFNRHASIALYRYITVSFPQVEGGWKDEYPCSFGGFMGGNSGSVTTTLKYPVWSPTGLVEFTIKGDVPMHAGTPIIYFTCVDMHVPTQQLNGIFGTARIEVNFFEKGQPIAQSRFVATVPVVEEPWVDMASLKYTFLPVDPAHSFTRRQMLDFMQSFSVSFMVTLYDYEVHEHRSPQVAIARYRSYTTPFVRMVKISDLQTMPNVAFPYTITVSDVELATPKCTLGETTNGLVTQQRYDFCMRNAICRSDEYECFRDSDGVQLYGEEADDACGFIQLPEESKRSGCRYRWSCSSTDLVECNDEDHGVCDQTGDCRLSNYTYPSLVCFDRIAKTAADDANCEGTESRPTPGPCTAGQCNFWCQDRTVSTAEEYVQCDDPKAFVCDSDSSVTCGDTCATRKRLVKCFGGDNLLEDQAICAHIRTKPSETVDDDGPVVAGCDARVLSPSYKLFAEQNGLAFRRGTAVDDLSGAFFPDATYKLNFFFEDVDATLFYDFSNKLKLSPLVDQYDLTVDVTAKGTNAHATVLGSELAKSFTSFDLVGTYKRAFPSANAVFSISVHTADVTSPDSEPSTITRGVVRGPGAAEIVSRYIPLVDADDDDVTEGTLAVSFKHMDFSKVTETAGTTDISGVTLSLPEGWSGSDSTVCHLARAEGDPWLYTPEVKWLDGTTTEAMRTLSFTVPSTGSGFTGTDVTVYLYCSGVRAPVTEVTNILLPVFLYPSHDPMTAIQYDPRTENLPNQKDRTPRIVYMVVDYTRTPGPDTYINGTLVFPDRDARLFSDGLPIEWGVRYSYEEAHELLFLSRDALRTVLKEMLEGCDMGNFVLVPEGKALCRHEGHQPNKYAQCGAFCGSMTSVCADYRNSISAYGCVFQTPVLPEPRTCKPEVTLHGASFSNYQLFIDATAKDIAPTELYMWVMPDGHDYFEVPPVYVECSAVTAGVCFVNGKLAFGVKGDDLMNSKPAASGFLIKNWAVDTDFKLELVRGSATDKVLFSGSAKTNIAAIETNAFHTICEFFPMTKPADRFVGTLAVWSQRSAYNTSVEIVASYMEFDLPKGYKLPEVDHNGRIPVFVVTTQSKFAFWPIGDELVRADGIPSFDRTRISVKLPATVNLEDGYYRHLVGAIIDGVIASTETTRCSSIVHYLPASRQQTYYSISSGGLDIRIDRMKVAPEIMYSRIEYTLTREFEIDLEALRPQLRLNEDTKMAVVPTDDTKGILALSIPSRLGFIHIGMDTLSILLADPFVQPEGNITLVARDITIYPGGQWLCDGGSCSGIAVPNDCGVITSDLECNPAEERGKAAEACLFVSKPIVDSGCKPTFSDLYFVVDGPKLKIVYSSAAASQFIAEHTYELQVQFNENDLTLDDGHPVSCESGEGVDLWCIVVNGKISAFIPPKARDGVVEIVFKGISYLDNVALPIGVVSPSGESVYEGDNFRMITTSFVSNVVFTESSAELLRLTANGGGADNETDGTLAISMRRDTKINEDVTFDGIDIYFTGGKLPDQLSCSVILLSPSASVADSFPFVSPQTSFFADAAASTSSYDRIKGVLRIERTDAEAGAAADTDVSLKHVSEVAISCYGFKIADDVFKGTKIHSVIFSRAHSKAARFPRASQGVEITYDNDSIASAGAHGKIYSFDLSNYNPSDFPYTNALLSHVGAPLDVKISHKGFLSYLNIHVPSKLAALNTAMGRDADTMLELSRGALERLYKLTSPNVVVKAETLPVGDWYCEDDDAENGFSECSVPDNCGKGFQGPPVCAAGSSIMTNENACAFSENDPGDDLDVSGCPPTLENVGLVYTSALLRMELSFGVGSVVPFTLIKGDLEITISGATDTIAVAAEDVCTFTITGVSGQKRCKSKSVGDDKIVIVLSNYEGSTVNLRVDRIMSLRFGSDVPLTMTATLTGYTGILYQQVMTIPEIGFVNFTPIYERGITLATGPDAPETDGFEITLSGTGSSQLGNLVSLIVGVSAPVEITHCTAAIRASETNPRYSVATPVIVGTATPGAKFCPDELVNGVCPSGNLFSVVFSQPIEGVKHATFACTHKRAEGATAAETVPRRYTVALEYKAHALRMKTSEDKYPVFTTELKQAGFATADGEAYMRFTVSATSGRITVDTAALAAALNANRVAVESLSESTVSVFAVLPGHYAAVSNLATSSSNNNALATLVENSPAITGTGVALDKDSVVVGVAGAQFCGPYASAPAYRKCEVVDNCGTQTTEPRVCAGATLGSNDVAPLDSDETCGPADAIVPETSGCGAWMCTDPSGAHVPCDHPAVCVEGCEDEKHVLTPAEIEAGNGTLAAVCVKSGVAVSVSLCPEDVVPEPEYAEECTPTSECRLLCTDSNGNAAACASSAAWSACSASCGSGTQTRHLACSASAVRVGEPVDEIAAALCKYAPFAYERERPCTGTSCASFAWRCAPLADDTDDGTGLAFDDYGPCDGLSWGDCSTDCGTGTRNRAVACAALSADSTVVDVGVSEQLCRPHGAKPAASEPCTEDACADAEWKCYAVGGDPSKPVDCAGAGGFACPAQFCGVATGEREVACYDGSDMLPNSRCDNSSTPATAVECPLQTTTCMPSTEASKCEFDADGNFDEVLANLTCIDKDASTPPEPYRRLKCIDRESGDVVDDAWCGSASVLLRKCSLPQCDSDYSTEWRSTRGECVDAASSCATYRVNKVECVAVVPGSSNTVVEDFLCPADERPERVSACGASDGVVTCANGGTCKKTPVVHQGISYPDVSSGTCICPAGLGGADCSLSLSVSSVSVDIDGNDYHIKWVLSTSEVPGTAAVTLAGGDLPVPATLGVVSAQSLSLLVPVSLVARMFPPGNYSLSVAVGGSSAETTLYHRGLCFTPAHACLNDGHCSETTGKCECVGEFSGNRCEVTPCDNKGCNIATSQCDTNDDGVASCECATDDDDEPLFVGELCNDPVDGCDEELPSCSNGGVRAGYIANNTAMCGACECKSNWAGDVCEDCGLDSVCVNGKADDACESCVCNRGYQGESCRCRAVIVTMTFNRDGGVAWYPGSSSALSVWLRNVVSAVKHLLNDDDLTVTAYAHIKVDTESGATYVQVTLLVGPPCADAVDAFAPAAVEPEMFATYTGLDALRDAFESGDAAKIEGLKEVNLDAGLGLEDPNCAGAGANCPRNLGNGGVVDPKDGTVTPGDGGSSGLSTGALVGIIVGSVVGGLLIIFLILACCCGWCCFGSSSRAEDREVEMSTAAV